MILNCREDFLFLGTVLIKIKCNNGEFKDARAIINNGSQLNLVTEDFDSQLDFKPRMSYNTFSSVGGVNVTT